MTTTFKTFLASIGLVAAAASSSGCNDSPATVVATNGTGDATVYKVWWNATLLAAPVPPGAASAAERTAPGEDFAYALIAPGGSPPSGEPPTALIALRSTARLSAARGQQLEIRVSDETFAGHCAAGNPLDAESAAFIVERIFPGDFAGVTYDPTTCTTSAPTDGGADAGTDGATDQ